MIYLIGGPPRVGKSILAQRLISSSPMPSFSCDFLYEIDQLKKIPNFANLDILEKGEAFYPILKQLVSNIERQSENCLIEGEVILPRHAFELSKEYQIKCCFLGMSECDLETIIQYGGHFNWPKYKIENDMSSEVEDLVQRTILRSKVIESECELHNQKYFDLGTDFEARQQEAVNFLTLSSE